jgi:hypothetical protein
MIPSVRRRIYSMMLLLIIFSYFDTPNPAFSGSKAVSTSKAVFYVY